MWTASRGIGNTSGRHCLGGQPPTIPLSAEADGPLGVIFIALLPVINTIRIMHVNMRIS